MGSQHNHAPAPPVLLTVGQFSERHPAFSVGSLRWLIFHDDANGLKVAGAVVRVGRRVLINEARFFAWIDSQQSGGASAMAGDPKPVRSGRSRARR